jgi:hypothetical protein
MLPLLPLDVMVGVGPPFTPCGAGRGKSVNGGLRPTMTGLISRASPEAVILTRRLTTSYGR